MSDSADDPDVLTRQQRLSARLAAPGADVAGLLDRVSGLRQVSVESERSEYAGSPLAVVVVDVGVRAALDGPLGPASSAEMAIAVAVLRDHLSRRDHLARLGGSQLLCLLPGTDGALAKECAWRAGEDYGRMVRGGTFTAGATARLLGEDAARLLSRARGELERLRSQPT